MWLLDVACVSAHCNEWNVSKRLRAESVKCTKCMKWNTKKENDGVHSSTYARTHTQRRRTIHFHLTLYKMHKITFFICRCLCVCVRTRAILAFGFRNKTIKLSATRDHLDVWLPLHTKLQRFFDENDFQRPHPTNWQCRSAFVSSLEKVEKISIVEFPLQFCRLLIYC